MNNCTLKIDMCDGTDCFVGTSIVCLDFVPSVGMHFGPTQLLTVCQVHYLGSDKLRNNNFEVHLRSTYNQSFSRIEQEFQDSVWKWEIAEDEDKAPAPETELEPHLGVPATVSKSVERRLEIQKGKTDKEITRLLYLEIAKAFEASMQCNCDLDSWEPEKLTGHSFVCRIHKATIEKMK